MTEKEIFEVEANLEELRVQQAKKEAELMELRAKNAEKLAKRKITAKEARELADNSTKVLSQIYKILRGEAEEGRVRLDWSTDYLSNACLTGIITALEADGYTVSHEADNRLLTITW